MAAIEMTPTRLDLTFVRGDTWTFSITFPNEDGEPIDLTGSTWLSQIKPAGANNSIDADQPVFATWNIDDSAQEDGIITLTLDESVTALADVGITYWYDIEQTRSGIVATPVQGTITVKPDVTIAPEEP